jgi:hypothetical protein
MIENIVIVPSAIGARIGVIDIKDRFTQTLEGLKSIRERIPNSYIIFCDCSLESTGGDAGVILPLVDQYFDFAQHEQVRQFSMYGMKSHGELVMFVSAIQFALANIDMSSVDRIFKLGGRGILNDQFDIEKYKEAKGKYVFKTPSDSWMGNGMKIYETRMYSLHKDNIDDYFKKFDNIIGSCEGGFQSEHSHYKCLDPDMVYPFETLGLQYVVSSTGQTAYD